MEKDYYAILGVKSTATQAEIKKTFQVLAHIYHPDKNGSDGQRFKEINEAYQILSNKQKRAQYDDGLKKEQKAQSNSDQSRQSQSDKGESQKPTNSNTGTQKTSNGQTVSAVISIILIVTVISFMAIFGSSKKDFSTSGSSNQYSQNSNPSLYSQIPSAGSDDSFPMNDNSAQYGWYDKHNVAMAYRCYPGTKCTAEQWAYAVYDNSNDTRGVTLQQEANAAQAAYLSQFPVDKCVTEQGVKVCDLSHNVQSINQDGTRQISFQANTIDCVNVSNDGQTQNQGNTIKVDSGNTYCASDLGAVYIDPTIQVIKHYGEIRLDSNSNFSVPSAYKTCIWAYEGGNGAIPYIEVSNNTGPSNQWSGYYNARAFCTNGNNEVDIYSQN